MPTSTAIVPNSRLLHLCCVTALIVCVAGCEKQEEVTKITVPTHESIQTPEHQRFLARRKYRPERILAAIVPNNQSLWFFKIQGAPNDVESNAADFRSLLTSLKFKGELPRWTLPSGWRELPGDQNRYKTLATASVPPLGVSVTVLPAGKNPTDGLRDNINRWRGQIELPMIQAEDLPAYSETLTSGGISITLMDATGRSRPDPDETSEIDYEAPAEWTKVAPKPFTIAVFEAREGTGEDAKKATISLSRAGGSKLENVNRWRGQMGLGPLAKGDVESALQKITIGSRTGELIELKTDGRTMLGLMLEDNDQTVFVKLDGHPDLAVRERERFEKFAKSLQF